MAAPSRPTPEQRAEAVVRERRITELKAEQERLAAELSRLEAEEKQFQDLLAAMPAIEKAVQLPAPSLEDLIAQVRAGLDAIDLSVSNVVFGIRDETLRLRTELFLELERLLEEQRRRQAAEREVEARAEAEREELRRVEEVVPPAAPIPIPPSVPVPPSPPVKVPQAPVPRAVPSDLKERVAELPEQLRPSAERLLDQYLELERQFQAEAFPSPELEEARNAALSELRRVLNARQVLVRLTWYVSKDQFFADCILWLDYSPPYDEMVRIMDRTLSALQYYGFAHEYPEDSEYEAEEVEPPTDLAYDKAFLFKIRIKDYLEHPEPMSRKEIIVDRKVVLP